VGPLIPPLAPSPLWACLPAWVFFLFVRPIIHLYRACHCHIGPFRPHEPLRSEVWGGLRRLCSLIDLYLIAFDVKFNGLQEVAGNADFAACSSVDLSVRLKTYSDSVYRAETYAGEGVMEVLEHPLCWGLFFHSTAFFVMLIRAKFWLIYCKTYTAEYSK